MVKAAALDGTDWAEMREQIALVQALLKKRYDGAALMQTIADLPLLQQVLDDGVFDSHQVDELRALTVAFGNMVQAQLGFEWIIEDDGQTREPVLRLKPSGKLVVNLRRALLRKLGPALDRVPGAVGVVGHADASPAGTHFASNNDLSLARARATVRALGLADAKRASAEGHADAEPVAPNDSDANRAKNRRVVFLLKPAP